MAYYLALLLPLTAVFLGGVYGGDFTVMCYFTNWAQWRQGLGAFAPEDILPNMCTHILYAFNDLNADSLTINTRVWNELDMMSRVLSLKNDNSDLKVLLALGGGGGNNSGFVTAASTESNRQLFARNAVTFLRSHGFDGLDLDWERPEPEQKVNFTLTLQALRRAFEEDAAATGEDCLLLTAAVWAFKPVAEVTYEVDKIHLYLDHVMVMAYDYYGATWSEELGHNSPLYVPAHDRGVAGLDLLSQNATLFWWQKLGTPREKLVLGLATYGRTFRMSEANLHSPGDAFYTPVPGDQGPVTAQAGHLAYYEVCQLLSSGFTSIWCDDSKVPYAYGPRNGHWEWISYDNVDSMTAKANYIVRTGLGGAMFWNLDKDDFEHNLCGQGRYPLINTVSDILRFSLRTTTTIAPTTTTTTTIAATTTAEITTTKITSTNEQVNSTGLASTTTNTGMTSRTITSNEPMTTIATTIKTVIGLSSTVDQNGETEEKTTLGYVQEETNTTHSPSGQTITSSQNHPTTTETERQPLMTSQNHVATTETERQPLMTSQNHVTTTETERQPLMTSQNRVTTTETERQPLMMSQNRVTTTETEKQPLMTSHNHVTTTEAERQLLMTSQNHTTTTETERQPLMTSQNHATTTETERQPLMTSQNHATTTETERQPLMTSQNHATTTSTQRHTTSTATQKGPFRTSQIQAATTTTPRQPFMTSHNQAFTTTTQRLRFTTSQNHTTTKTTQRQPFTTSQGHTITEIFSGTRTASKTQAMSSQGLTASTLQIQNTKTSPRQTSERTRVLLLLQVQSTARPQDQASTGLTGHEWNQSGQSTPNPLDSGSDVLQECGWVVISALGVWAVSHF